ncbi:MAG: methylated-DNA--[protein]-cysteine S-methyltransferase [Treponema sp.]|nr:methylated-DNA--[protein]-cysteine S-methyltransferase [Treponema sp.]
MIYTCTIDTPLGLMLAAAANEPAPEAVGRDGDALTGLWFAGQKYYPADAEHWIKKPDTALFKALRAWLAAYFAGENPAPDLPLAPRGSPFQQEVWRLLREIPYGQRTTYGDIAARIARGRGLASMSAQAVGGAVGHNPLSLLIPCHRVLGSAGRLTGYAGGLDKKKALLELEEKTKR